MQKKRAPLVVHFHFNSFLINTTLSKSRRKKAQNVEKSKSRDLVNLEESTSVACIKFGRGAKRSILPSIPSAGRRQWCRHNCQRTPHDMMGLTSRARAALRLQP